MISVEGMRSLSFEVPRRALNKFYIGGNSSPYFDNQIHFKGWRGFARAITSLFVFSNKPRRRGISHQWSMSVHHPSTRDSDINIPPSDFSHDLCKQISRAYFFVMSAVNMETCARICNRSWFISGHWKLISPRYTIVTRFLDGDHYVESRRDERESGNGGHCNFLENVKVDWCNFGLIFRQIRFLLEIKNWSLGLDIAECWFAQISNSFVWAKGIIKYHR